MEDRGNRLKAGEISCEENAASGQRLKGLGMCQADDLSMATAVKVA